MKKAAVESFWVSVIFVCLLLFLNHSKPTADHRTILDYTIWFGCSFVGTFIYRGIIKQGK